MPKHTAAFRSRSLAVPIALVTACALSLGGIRAARGAGPQPQHAIEIQSAPEVAAPERRWRFPKIRLFDRGARASAQQGASPQRRSFRSALRSMGQKLRTAKQRVCDLGRRACRALSPANLRKLPGKAIATGKRLCDGAVQASKKLWSWCKANPRKAIGVALGTAAMLGTVIYAAPALSAGIAQLLAPMVGKTAASILGTATGGALASGSRSLLVHVTPMVTGVDPFNAKQLTIDVGMSSTFGFFGFAQAAALKTITAAMGVAGLGLFATNVVGLVGYEVVKDYLQNRIRNRVANDPKKFKDIAFDSAKMEFASNVHRCIPSSWYAAVGLPGVDISTNFLAKIAGDLVGTIWWDRIVNKRNPGNAGQGAGGGQHVEHALAE